ncbi:RidA family protein [Paraburkholderia sp. BCC1886]|uniref:RidA family protein n=1 Tax=Paraburkholderia sp. BCC1886 TaxID=2562670 RepID=UPI0011837894|nr:RidA family protein [Paraburkholderia sp. BCC1886]
MSADKKLEDLIGSERRASAPAANYQNATRWGDLIFLSGKSLRESVRGRLGAEFTVEDGQRFARQVALELLLVLRDELGSLDRIKQFVELQGFVNATADFEDHAKVLDGASDVLVEVLGNVGIHSRSVFGASSLRGGQPVILRAVVGIG